MAAGGRTKKAISAKDDGFQERSDRSVKRKRYAAFSTRFDLRQEVQTAIRFVPPLTFTRTF